MHSKSILFLVESGKPLEMAQAHVADLRRVELESSEICRELGADRFQPSLQSGAMAGAYFAGEIHPDFKKPKRGGPSYPKKGSQWERRLSELVGYEDPAQSISQAFNIPLSLSASRGGDRTWHAIGSPLRECGFMWLNRRGPFAIWAPDVEAEMAAYAADGWQVTNIPSDYKVVIPGARRILSEEWDLMVAQHKLNEARARAVEMTAA